MRALIVDDDQTSCQLLAKILSSSGLDTEWTTDSLTGYDLSLQHHYDLYVLDVRMPGLLGTTFAEGLKKKYPTAKIVLISAFADERLQQTATSLGVSLLSKPFDPDRLLQVTADMLRQGT